MFKFLHVFVVPHCCNIPHGKYISSVHHEAMISQPTIRGIFSPEEIASMEGEARRCRKETLRARKYTRILQI